MYDHRRATPELMEDVDGRFRLKKKSGSYRWRVNLFNSAGFVHFNNDKPDEYGVILRSGRYNLKKGRQLEKYHYVIRYFEPLYKNDEERTPRYTFDEIQNLLQTWDEETKTGYKTIMLSKLKLSPYNEAFSSPVPLSMIYLGKYRCSYNPSWIVSTRAKITGNPGERGFYTRPSEIQEFNRRLPYSKFQTKVRQRRSPRKRLCA
jgi:hypothetical protein